jgi:Pyridoxamine 5'-phosphate oxidase
MTSPLVEVMPRTGRGTQAETDAGNAQPFTWEAALAKFREGGWFWLSTVRPDGRPHAMPCFAAWSDSSFFVASKAGTRKSRNLDANPGCVLTRDGGEVHLIVEGRARRVTDEQGLRAASEAMMGIYEWPTTPVAGELDAEYGAPTSGGPPYRVYKITPTLGFALPTNDQFAPTRFTFDDAV